MYQSIRIATRNVARQLKRTLLLGGAVAFGFFVITLVDGFTGGIVAAVKDNFSHAFGGHLYLSGSVVSERGSEIGVIEDDKAVMEALDAIRDKVASVHRRSSGRATLYFGTKERAQRIEGVDFADEPDFAGKLEIDEGSLEALNESGSLVLPAETARKLGVAVGESLLLKTETVTGQQNLGEATLIATTPDSGLFGTGRGYMRKADLNALIGLSGDKYQTINIHLTDVEDSEEAASAFYGALALRAPVAERGGEEGMGAGRGQMARMLGGGGLKSVAVDERWTGTKFTLTTIEDVISPILSLVSTLDMISIGVFLVLLAIIMIGILNSYRMVMIERTAEIGTMRAIGVQKGTIRDIFIWEALVTAAAGAAAGFLLGLAAIGALSAVSFDAGGMLSLFLSKGRLGFVVDPATSARNFLILCLMSLAAVYGPAKSASRMDPAQALRTSY
jgi:putative ABC transport system permease protein